MTAAHCGLWLWERVYALLCNCREKGKEACGQVALWDIFNSLEVFEEIWVGKIAS